MMGKAACLGVKNEVLSLFSPGYKILENGSLEFPYHRFGAESGSERFDNDLHLIPATSGLWMLCYFPITSVRDLYLFPSAIEAIAYFQVYPEKLHGRFPWAAVALGLTIQRNHAVQLCCFKKAKKHFVFGRDLPGRVADCKLALWLKGLDVAFYLQSGKITFDYKRKTFQVPEDAFTLFRLQQLTGLRNLGRAIKPHMPYHSFHELITNRNI